MVALVLARVDEMLAGAAARMAMGTLSKNLPAPVQPRAKTALPPVRRPRYGLTDNACHVILYIVDPRFLSQMESHDVVSIICQALARGHPRARWAGG